MPRSITQIVMPYASLDDCWSYAPPVGGISNSAVAVTVRAAQGAGIRSVISSLMLSWGTLGAATEFAIRDGAGGTVLFRASLGTAAGFLNYTPETPWKGSAATLLEIITITGVTGNVYCNLTGYNAVV